MLKNCVFPTNYNRFKDAKCGEIICQNETNFAIVCVFCKVKLFEFNDFLAHFRNVHLQEFPPLGEADSNGAGAMQWGCVEMKQEEFIDTELEFENVKCFTGAATVTAGLETASTQEQPAFWDTSNSNHGDYNSLTKVENDPHDDLIDSSVSSKDEDNWQPTASEAEDAEEEEHIIPQKKKSPKQNKCEACNKFYTTPRSLSVHKKLKHGKVKDFKCGQCSEAFVEARFLQSHLCRAHIDYHCSTCNKVCKSARGLKQHEEIHQEGREFVCNHEGCGKMFDNVKRLSHHKRLHTRNYVCEICGYRTYMQSVLDSHKRQHTGEKPFACDVCGKHFSTRALVAEHKPMHSAERPHKCNVCEATFSRAKALYHHKHLHLGEKKFKCRICGNAYAQMAGLSAHMRQHKMEGLV